MEPDQRPVAHRQDSTDCIVQSSLEYPMAPLSEPRDFNSWATLLKAAQIREFQPLLDIAQNLQPNEIPQI